MQAENTICIIEDNLPIRNLLSLLFKRNGFRTAEFENGKSAIDWLQANKPNGIICDIMLPDISGNEILENVRSLAHGASIPMIVVTGFANNHDKEKYLQQGFNGYIPKPINVATFVSEVEEILKENAN